MFVLVEEQPVVETEAAEIVARDASVDNMINPEDREVQVILLYLIVKTMVIYAFKQITGLVV